MAHGIQMHINLEMSVSKPSYELVFWIARPSVWRLTLPRRVCTAACQPRSHSCLFSFPFFFALHNINLYFYTPCVFSSTVFPKSETFLPPLYNLSPLSPTRPPLLSLRFFSSLLFHASFLCLIAAGWNLLIPLQLSIPPIQCYCSPALFNYPSVDLTRQRRLGGLFGLSITATRLWTDTKQLAPGMMRQKAVQHCWCELEVTEKWLQSNMPIYCFFPPSLPQR